MPEISRARLPGSGRIYDLKDAQARAEIAGIKATITGAMAFIGVTDTRLYDGSRVTPIYIDDEDVFPVSGNVAIYDDKEFIYNGSVWREFGSTSGFKSLAFKDEVSATYKPEGTVTTPRFEGKQATISASFSPSGVVAVSPTAGEITYTPEGTVTQPTVSVVPKYERITSYVAGNPPSCTLPKFRMTVSEENLKFEWEDGEFNSGSQGAQGEEIDVVTGLESVNVSAIQFQGTGVRLAGSFTGQSTEINIDYKPEGTITPPLFEGTETTITSR